MKRLPIALAIVLLLGGIGWLIAGRLTGAATSGTLYGNVEIRQVDLAFNSEGTVLAMQKQEGDPVATGDIVATLDDATYRSAVALASARRDAAQAELDKLLHGTRAEDIDQARANLASAQAVLANAQVSFQRQATLVITSATPRQAVDDARRALDSAQAMVSQTQARPDGGAERPQDRGYRRRTRRFA